MKRLFLLKLMA